jgi:uncharacterized integral membrane protein
MILLYFVLFVALTVKMEYIDDTVENPLKLILNAIWVCGFVYLCFILMGETN